MSDCNIISNLDNMLNDDEPAEEGAGLVVAGGLVAFITIASAISTFKSNRTAKKIALYDVYDKFAEERLSKVKYFKYFPKTSELFDIYFQNAEAIQKYWNLVEPIIKKQTSMNMEDYENNRERNIEKINNIRKDLIKNKDNFKSSINKKIKEIKKENPIIGTAIRKILFDSFDKYKKLVESPGGDNLFKNYFANSNCKDEFHGQIDQADDEDDEDYGGVNIREPFFDACANFVNSYEKILSDEFEIILENIQFQVKGNGKDIKNASMDSIIEGGNNIGIMSSLESLLNEDVPIESAATNNIDTLSAVLESDLSAADRRQIPTDQFGLPSARKYPLNDEIHVRQAIKFFHFCKGPDRKELASNIVKRMKSLNMPLVLSEKATLRKYLSSSQLEGFKTSEEQSEEKK